MDIEYYNNTTVALIVRPSNIKNAGLGLFTLESIDSNKLIGYYEGTLKSNSNYISDYSFELSSRYFIDADTNPRCNIAMVNDAYNSPYKYNCEFRMIYYDHNKKKLPVKDRKIALYSICEIDQHDELFANYGSEYWISRK